jgi:hypothetical protein
MTELVINNHDFTSTEVSLFFLSHEYYMNLYNYLRSWSLYDLKSSVQKADQIVWKMKEVTEWAQMTMTLSADTERNDESEKTAVLWLQERRQSLTKS